MTPRRVREIIEAYGGDPGRWPAAERDAALQTIASDETLAALQRQASALDGLLDGFVAPGLALDPDSLARRVADTAQERPALSGGGAIVPDWRQWFGWPKLAGLAMAGIIGFTVGWTGLDSNMGFAVAPAPVVADQEDDGFGPLLEVGAPW